MDLTSLQMAALQKSASQSARIASKLALEIGAVELFLKKVAGLISVAGPIVSEPYALSLCSIKGGQQLNSATIVALLGQSFSRFLVDIDLNLVSAEVADLEEEAVRERTLSEGRLEIIVNPNQDPLAFVCGKFGTQMVKGVPTTAKWQRPARELAKAISDHFEAQVLRQQAFEYWCGDRILIRGPKGTERLFQSSLYWWLKTYTVDQLSVEAEAYGFGQNKTDIKVTTATGSHVVEIKWLGTNEAGTSYNNPPRIDEGLVQVGEYFKNDRTLVSGHLVVYDARIETVHASDSSFNEKFRDPRCNLPMVLFLVSDTPSMIAKKIASAAPAPAHATTAVKIKLGGRTTIGQLVTKKARTKKAQTKKAQTKKAQTKKAQTKKAQTK